MKEKPNVVKEQKEVSDHSIGGYFYLVSTMSGDTFILYPLCWKTSSTELYT